jgi:hypothetical protein
MRLTVSVDCTQPLMICECWVSPVLSVCRSATRAATYKLNESNEFVQHCRFWILLLRRGAEGNRLQRVHLLPFRDI